MDRLERVACYVRVSTEEQKLHGISLDAQRLKLTEYANTHKLKIIKWYEDEGVSGRKLIKNRPALQAMLNDAHAGLFDRIIFIKLDRFFRSVAEYHECMKYINPVVWTATEEKYDLTTANGRAFVNMKLTIAELEADQTGERIKIVNDYKVKTSQALTGSNSQGLAFKVEKIDNIKKVVKDPDTKDLIEDLINYFIIHQNKRKTLLYINDKYKTNISYSSLSNVLTDTKLYGYYRGNANYCDPYIDVNTFNQIQNILTSNIKTSHTSRSYLFSGLLVCPVCGKKLAGICSNKRTNKKPSGKVYTYVSDRFYYRCNSHTKDNLCTYSKRLSETYIETYLLDNLNAIIKSTIIDVSITDNQSNPDRDYTLQKIENIKSEMKNLTLIFRKNRISESEYDTEYTKLEKSLDALQANLNPVNTRDLTIYNDLVKSGWKNVYDALTRENKRSFWRKYIKRIELKDTGEIDSIIFF